LAGKIAWNDVGDVVFNFGKNKGMRIQDDLGYCHWMLDKDFSANTKMHLAEQLDIIYKPDPRDAQDDSDHPF
jgi:hypothetical protein